MKYGQGTYHVAGRRYFAVLYKLVGSEYVAVDMRPLDGRASERNMDWTAVGLAERHGHNGYRVAYDDGGDIHYMTEHVCPVIQPS